MLVDTQRNDYNIRYIERNIILIKGNKMAVVVKTEDEKPATFGWLQFEKKGLGELRKLATKAPTAMSVLLYLAQNMSRTNAIAFAVW